LNLTVTGRALQENVKGGPKVCQQGNPLQCYQPSESNSLNITLVAPNTVFIDVGQIVNGGSPLIVTSNTANSWSIAQINNLPISAYFSGASCTVSFQ
jgi:hypothetical protein